MRTVEDTHTFNHKSPMQTHGRTHARTQQYKSTKISTEKNCVAVSSCGCLQIGVPITNFFLAYRFGKAI
jgi:hypothetical protein